MNSKHTPGPWEFDGEYVWADSVNGYVANPSTEDVISDEVREANGRLIAAAPRMYDFIERKADAGNEEAIELLEAINGRA